MYSDCCCSNFLGCHNRPYLLALESSINIILDKLEKIGLSIVVGWLNWIKTFMWVGSLLMEASGNRYS